MPFKELKHNNTNFKLSNECKNWFSLPEKDVYDFIDLINIDTDIFYDLGAAEGRFTVYSQVKGIKTYSFEPDCYNYEVLENNVNNNINKNNVKIYKVAISDVNKKLYLLKQQPFKGGHLKILENGERISTIDIKEKEEVNAVILDDFIEKNNLPYPTHIKVDIDGNELNFIKSSKKVLTHTKYIHIELTTKNKDIILDELNKYGFKILKEIDILSLQGTVYKDIKNYILCKE